MIFRSRTSHLLVIAGTIFFFLYDATQRLRYPRVVSAIGRSSRPDFSFRDILSLARFYLSNNLSFIAQASCAQRLNHFLDDRLGRSTKVRKARVHFRIVFVPSMFARCSSQFHRWPSSRAIHHRADVQPLGPSRPTLAPIGINRDHYSSSCFVYRHSRNARPPHRSE